MDNIVKKLFEAGLLSEDDKISLQKSFDDRVEAVAQEVRESVETQVREEMAQRFEHDKSTLVEAMDRMLTDVVQKAEADRASEVAKLREAKERYEAAVQESRDAYKARIKGHAEVLESFVMSKLNSELGEFSEDRNAVADMRVKLAAALAENKADYKKRLKEHMNTMRNFVMEKLAKELGSLREQQEALASERADLAEQAEAHKAMLEEQFGARVKKLDEFVVRQVTKELREFQEDKRALVDKRVQLVSESREKLAETQRKFVAEAAKMVDEKVTESLKVELKQLHEDLERNRQNSFGRRIFEAVAAEYMTSYFGEGTEVKKLQSILESKDAELATAKKQLAESQQHIDAASRKAKLAEDIATRTSVMSELLSPLAREKRAVMQELLESVKTAQLRDAFNKYLPAVLNEGSKKTAPQRRALTEAPAQESSTVAVTGDQRTNRLLETVQAQDSDTAGVNTETAEILRLAGISK